jgi:hypothetical protein
MQALLKDVDMSLLSHKKGPAPARRELDIIPSEGDLNVVSETERETDAAEYEGRKSPAAHFGSSRIGSVVLPLELQHSINLLISGEE